MSTPVVIQDDGQVSKLTWTTDYGLEVELLVRTPSLSRDARLGELSRLVLVAHDLVDETAREVGWEDAMTVRPGPDFDDPIDEYRRARP